MKWNEVKSIYPDQWVKLKIINSHTEDDYFYVDDMEVIESIKDDKKATFELTRCKGDNLVFHTSHDVIRTKLIKSLGLFRSIPNQNKRDG